MLLRSLLIKQKLIQTYKSGQCCEPVKTDNEEKEPPVVELTMTGGFAMSRQYTRMNEIANEILRMRSEGKTRREIWTHFGISKKQYKNFLNRRNRINKKIKTGILLRRRGRPPKGHKFAQSEKDNEIKRLKMENELLRDFLRAAGRM